MFAIFFAAWVAFSFLAHRLAKCYFQTISDEDPLVLTLSAVVVTAVQLLMCGVLALIRAPADTSKPTVGALLSAAVPHAFGALATNYSMALIPAASTHVIKVMEPMVTAGIAWLAVRLTMSKTRLLAVVLVVTGAIGATWDPLRTLPTQRLGVQLALLSNILYGSRNVMIKHLLGRSVVFHAAAVGKMSLLGAAVLSIPLVLGCLFKPSSAPILVQRLNGAVALFVLGSAICHATYTYISTCVILNRISVIGHALANVSKRVLVIALLYVFGQKGYLSPLFLIVCFLGLAIYTSAPLTAETNKPQKEGDNDSAASLYRSRIPVVILTVMSVTLVTGAMVATAVRSVQTLKSGQHHASFNVNNMLGKILYYDTKAGESRSIQQSHPTDAAVDFRGRTNSTNATATSVRPVVNEPLINQPNGTDATMKTMLTASDAVKEAVRIQLEIYKEVMGHYKKAVLIGIANHNNYGDSAITVGEFIALNKLGIELIYYCSTKNCSDLSEAKKAIQKTAEPVVILSSGGGNFGNWKHEYELRAKLMETFKDNEVIVLPQSVDFESLQAMEDNARAMNVHSNVTYLFRDHKSYDIVVNSGLYKYRRVLLCPDAAVQIGMQTFSFQPTHDIVWLKRKDKESFHSSLPEFPKNLSILVSDWTPPEQYLNIPSGVSILERSYSRLLYAFRLLSQGKVIITDRLHAHILSVLLDKPNVILDNSYKKLSSYHAAWTPSVHNVLLAANATDAVDKARHLLHKHY